MSDGPDLTALLGELFDDPTVTSVEFGKFGGDLLDCRIRRSRAVHVICGQGRTPLDALANAVHEYER